SFFGCFGFIQRNCYEKMGGFDERFLGWGGEDMELMMRLYYHLGPPYLLFDDIDVFHLTHTASREEFNHRSRNMELYKSSEHNLGVNFYVNRLFGVYDDGIIGDVMVYRDDRGVCKLPVERG
ncbi:MAG: galactosyltransferase-related protein, partial [Candidatus Thiodiazotropha sp.]